MANEVWPALRSCNHKSCEESADEVNDRLSQLPDEILVSIQSLFKFKEAARNRLVSRKWNDLWGNFPCLNFEDSSAMEKIEGNDDLLVRERSNFVMWVNHIVEKHHGSAIDELTLTFDLDNSFQSHIDRWVVFAFEKWVKKLVLDFEPATTICRPFSEYYRYSAPLELFRNFANLRPTLTYLRLSHVNVSAEVVECLLLSCSFLENLSIQRSEYLTCIRASGSALPLKHLEISHCRSLKVIDICAPKLLSFKYLGHPLALDIANASSLSGLSIAVLRDHPIAFALDSFSKYFPQLEYLTLNMCLFNQMNLGINQCPALGNLKYLRLCVKANADETLLGWSPLVEACPVLEKLTLEFRCRYVLPLRGVVKHSGRPFKCLKTLEIIGFLGCPIDLDLVTFVLENGIMLEEVIIILTCNSIEEDKGQARAIELLKEKIPHSVKVMVKKIPHLWYRDPHRRVPPHWKKQEEEIILQA